MRLPLTVLLLILAWVPAWAQGSLVYMHALVQRDGLFFEGSSRVPFTGKVRGRGFIQDGKRHGPWIFFDDNGQRLSAGDFKAGEEDGPWVFFHPNGQMESRGAFKDGRQDGPWTFFNPNGTTILERSGTYRDGVLSN